MNKIYCEYCNFFKIDSFDLWVERYCKHPICFKLKNTPIEIKKVRVTDLDILNKNNNCKHFELKWWRKMFTKGK